jgi:ornithine cyclodeaminase
MANRRELDQAVLTRASVITVDSLEQAKEEAGDLIHGIAGMPRDGKASSS